MLSDDLHEECYRLSLELGGFKAALEKAFAAGRESAYDRDEWRVAYDCGLSGNPGGEGDLGYFRWVVGERKDAHIEHCRTGSSPWVRVPEAGGPDER